MSSFGFLIRSANLGYRSTLWKNIILLLGLLVTGCTSRSGLYDTEPPNFFTHEPPRFNYFPNDKGFLLQCVARGTPRPTITWMSTVTGEAVNSINGLLQILPNGSLFYVPFSPNYYRPDIHNSTVYCLASNVAGQIRSRDITVRAVMNQREEIHLEDVYTTKGNDALFKCLIPEPIKDFVSVTSWIKDSTFNIFPHSGGGGGRYFMVPSGELLIEGASINDSTSTFQCRTVNRLTGKTVESQTLARIKLEGDERESEPRILSHVSQLRLKEGETGVLLCLSDGHPTPTQGWFKADGFGGLENLRQSERIRIRRSAVIIENVGIQDGGTYICNATNRHGSARHQIQMIVQTPLAVQVLPSVLTVDVGKSAEFTCWTNSPAGMANTVGSGLNGGAGVGAETLSAAAAAAAASAVGIPHKDSSHRLPRIRWFKNGKELMDSTRVALSPSGDKLRIAYVQREDIGMIQCMVVSEKDMSQAAAQLRLGDASPHFIYRFIEQTLQPGQYVSLKCTATGNPTPRITWLLDGFVPPISERLLIGQYVTMNGDVVSHLNITRTKVEDGGEYSCTVNNTHGTLTHSARLNIYGLPYVRPMPPVTAIAGKTLTIKCPAAGFPLEWPIVWEKASQVLPASRRQVVSPDGVLTVRDVDRSADAGTYSCTARNKQGHSDQKSVQVHVVVAPKVSFNFPRSVSAGERLVVICYVSEGDTPIEIKWLKDSQPVVATAGDQMDRQVSTTRGDFDLALRINPLSAFDSGVYTCSATNKYGEARHSATLVVQVPPRITPFFFPSSVQVNQRAQVVCALQEGDPFTTTLLWLKNGELISGTSSQDAGTKAKIIEVQRDVALLIIDAADSTDNGNYTCVAQSDIEGLSDSVTANLIVRVPPKWLVQPKDQLHVLNGDTVKIPCQAAGFPVPTISWKKQMGNRVGSYHDISVQISTLKSPTEDILSDVNGSLIIRSANKGHQGVYLCEASNGIGSGISKVLRVVVNVPAKIRDRDQNTTTRVRTNAVLQCHAVGDPPLEISWRRSPLDNNLLLDPRYYVQTVNSSGGGLLSELKINNVIREDNGRYICSASNPFGKDHGSFWLVVKDVPDSPHGLTLAAKGSRFVRLGWSLAPEEFGNSQIAQFVIKYLAASGGGEARNGESEENPAVGEITVPGNVYSEMINNLKPATTYHFSVVAQNEIGSSGPSERLDVSTDGEPPPPPTNVQAIPLSATEIKILWDHPASELRRNFRGYYIGFRRYREEEQYQFSAVDGIGLIKDSGSVASGNDINAVEKDSYRREHFLRNLIPFTAYEIVIQGYNAFGVGALSEPIIANTLEDVPMFAPEGLTCSSISSHSLQVNFQALPKAQARGLLTGYKVYVESTDSGELEDEMLVKTTATTSLVVNGLQPWTNYSVHVAATTRVGEGVRSSPITCETEEDVPAKLEVVKAVVSSPTSVIVSWLPPRKKNGRLLSFNLYVLDASSSHNNNGRISGIKKKTVAPSVTFYEVDGLKTNEKYEFRVAAVTSTGEGKSTIARQTPVKNFGVAIVSIGEEYYVIWKTDIVLPCKAVGDPSPTHEWSRNLNSVESKDRVSFAADGSLLIRDVRKEDEGDYMCLVQNIRGSESINHSIYVQVPPAAPLVHGASSTHHSISIVWKQQEVDKVSPIKGYILHLKVHDEWTERRISRHLNSYEVLDLECGTRYQLYLTGINAAGIGKASNILKNLTTLGGVPQLNLPSPEMMLQVNSTWIRVKLGSWSDNGCPIKECRVLFRQQDHYFKWQTVAAELNSQGRDVDLIGLKQATVYTIRVSCHNSAGENEVEMTTKTLPLEASGSENSKGLLNNPVWKTTPAATTAATAFYLDWKLMGPIVLSSVAMIMAGGGLCLCIKKKPDGVGRSMEHLSGGTPSSSTYFKGNQRSNSHQLYMTVKKATPVKNQDLATVDHIPQYAEDIYPYATFELNEPNRREGRCNAAGTIDRNRSKPSGATRKSSKSGGDLLCNSKFKGRYPASKTDESEEYDSVDSDSEISGPIAVPGEFFIEYQEPIESKCQDFQFPQTRCGNQYEMAPARNPLFHHRLKSTPPLAVKLSQNDALELLCEYNQNEAGKSRERHHRPTCDNVTSAFCEPKQPKKGKNRGGGIGVTHHYADGGKNFNPGHIEPPSGFGDKCLSISEAHSTQASNEFAIAV